MALYTVYNNKDAGQDSLRAAIDAANASAGPDVIEFDSSFSISLSTALPQLTGDLTITGPFSFLSGAFAFDVGAANLTLETGWNLEGLQGTGSLSLSLGAALEIVGATNSSYAGDISGAGSLLKVGVGTFTLSGANTFTGGVTVNDGTLVLSGGAAIADQAEVAITGGTLRVDASETVGSIAGTGSEIVLGANLTTASGVSTQYDGVISGAGGLIKTGTGVLTLSGSNSFSGGLTMSAGMISVASDDNLGSGPLMLGSGTRLTVTGATTIDNAITLTGSTTYNSAVDQTLSGVISGAGGLTKTGAGTLTLSGSNTHAGVTVSGGMLSVASDDNLGAGAVYLGGATTLKVTGATTIDNVINLGGSATYQSAADQTLSGTISGAGGLTKTGVGTLTLSGSNTHLGGTTVSGGTLSVATDNNLGFGVVTLGGGTTLQVTSGITKSITLLGSATYEATVDHTLSGVISGAGGLTKTGAGTLTLSGANTFTGVLTVSGGTVVLAGGSAIDDGARVVLSGGTLRLDASETVGSIGGSGAVALGASTLTMGGDLWSSFTGVISGTGDLIKAGVGTLTLAGANTFTGDVTVSAGTLALVGGSSIDDASAVIVTGALRLDANETVGSIAGGGAITLSSGRLTTGGDDASTTFSGVISGAGGLTKVGDGTLTLSGVNTFTGAVTVSEGMFELRGGKAIGDTVAVTVNGGTLQVINNEAVGSIAGAGTINLGRDLTTGDDNTSTTFSGVIVGLAGALTKTGSGTLTLSGTNVYNGGTTVSGGTLSIAADSNLGAGAVSLGTGTTLQVTGATTITKSLTLAGSATYSSAVDQTLSGAISGAGGLTKTGAGTLTLSGVNTFTGDVTVSEGALELRGSGAIANTVAVTVSGGTLQVVDAEIVGSIAGAGAIHLIHELFAGDDNTTTTFSGVISGSGGLVKTGTGTLTLSGANTHGGSSQVSAGTLNVTGSLTSATGVGLDGALTGTGTLGELTVNGTLAPGASPGILHTGKLTFGSSGTLEAEIGGVTAGQYDQVQVTGAVTLDGALNVSLFGGFTPTTSGSYVLIANDGLDAVTGTFIGLAEGTSLTANGVKFAISYVGGDGNDVTLTYTAPVAPQPPEPTPNTPTPGADVLSLPATGGQMLAGAGDDTVTGGAGADYIHGNQGDDQITAGDGADTVLGGQGNDFIHGNQGDDLLFGDLGNDSLAGGQGNDFVHGNQGDDVLLGDLGNDTLLGGQGADVIQGGEGADYLSGDLGDDVLTGGGGADLFNFVLGQGRDVVTDFSQGDHIQLSISQAANFQALAAKMGMVGADTVISLGSETIVLAGVQMTSLAASDFLFV